MTLLCSRMTKIHNQRFDVVYSIFLLSNVNLKQEVFDTMLKKLYYITMKNIKLKLILLFILITPIANAQVGIGTTTPASSSILELKSADAALLITRVANVNVIISPINGMLIYDETDKCIKAYENGAWTGCGLVTLPKVSTLTCGSATFSSTTFNQNSSYTGTMTVPYTGGNGASYPQSAAVFATGVTGTLKATLQAGTLAIGNGVLTYSISGTPTSGGIATFPLIFGGLSCNVDVSVSSFPPFYIVITTLVNTNHLDSSVFPYFYDDLVTYTTQDVTVGNMQDLRLHQNNGPGGGDIIQTKFNTPLLVGGQIKIRWSRVENPTGLGLIVNFKNGVTTSQLSIDTLLNQMPNSTQTNSGNNMTITIDVVALTDTIIIQSSQDGQGADPILLEIEVFDNNNNKIPIN